MERPLRRSEISLFLLAEQRFQLSSRLLGRRRLRRLRSFRSTATQGIELSLSLSRGVNVSSRVGAGPGLEVVAKVCPLLVLHFLRHRLATMFRDADAVPLAHFANVQFGLTLAALVQAAQREAQVRKR